MPSVILSDALISQAKIASKMCNRSVAEQIEHCVKIGRIVEENPELPYQFIKDILIAQQEAQTKKVMPYEMD